MLVEPIHRQIDTSVSRVFTDVPGNIGELHRNAEVRGPGKVFRPYRDVRFSKDKSPYKPNLGGLLTTTGKKKFWRRKKLRAEFEMKLDDGTVVCSGEVSGMGVPR